MSSVGDLILGFDESGNVQARSLQDDYIQPFSDKVDKSLSGGCAYTRMRPRTSEQRRTKILEYARCHGLTKVSVDRHHRDFRACDGSWNHAAEAVTGYDNNWWTIDVASGRMIKGSVPFGGHNKWAICKGRHIPTRTI